ncbi:MAG: hypothetical protein EOP35_05950 [Rubrivivax sp.]|nr:MAG: hypothetical protein EOP35_05950 [Rubrivivax sp.]
MRRWLTIFLLVLLPLQFSWGAAAAYCQHESAGAARHLGHHPHEHKAEVGKTSLSDAAQLEAHKAHKAGQPCDSDCAFCHLGSATALIAALPAPPPQQASLIAPDDARAFSTRAPDLLDRPNWRIA